MEKKFILTFDVGTQSARTLLISNEGEVIGKKQIKYEEPYVSPQPGWAEQDPDMYYRAIAKTCRELKADHEDIWDQIEGVTITTIRATYVLVDKEGKPLRPAIVWLDKRQASGEPTFKGGAKMLVKAAGLDKALSLQYKKAPCNWIMQNQPEIWEKTDKFLMLSSYLTYKLTGNMTDAVANQVGHVPFDTKNRCWLDQKAISRPIFDIPDEKLYSVSETGEVMGRITAQVAADTGLAEGLPVIATGSDKACEILGLGCVEKTQAAMGFGTTATVSFNTLDYIEVEKHISPYASVIPGGYAPEFEILRGYWLVSWFKKEFAEKERELAAEKGVSAEELLNEMLDDVPAGCDGLLFQPYFTPNVSMPVARGAFVGLTEHHTRAHMYRSIIEGINFGLMEGVKRIEASGQFKFKEIRLGGGGSQSDMICQITADMFGIPVIRTHTFEATGVGSALAGFVGLGEFETFKAAAEAMVKTRDSFEPDMEKHAFYDRLYEQVYKEIYDKMAPLYGRLKEIYSNQ